jgi:hypothetical protein
MRLKPPLAPRIGSISLLVAAVLCGCQAPVGGWRYTLAQAETASPRSDSRKPMEAPPSPPPQAEFAHVAADKGLDRATSPTQRMLIYTGQVSMGVTDVEASIQATQKLAEEVGGYMLAIAGPSITIRVPAKQFFSVLERLKALGQILSKNVNAQDVTDEYVDLQLRLKNAEALRDRLVAILEKAASVKDTIEVERELNRVREDVERIKGRLAQLDKLIAYSTIEVSFTQRQQQQVKNRMPATPFPWLDEIGVERVLGIRG